MKAIECNDYQCPCSLFIGIMLLGLSLLRFNPGLAMVEVCVEFGSLGTSGNLVNWNLWTVKKDLYELNDILNVKPSM